MEEEISKKSYYLPKKLMEFFAKWCKPGRDYSTKVAGAILYYTTLSPDEREQCEKLACSANISDALTKLTNQKIHSSNLPKPLPIQPEETMLLSTDLEAQRFLNGILKHKPHLLAQLLSDLSNKLVSKTPKHEIKIEENPFSRPSFGFYRVFGFLGF